MYLEHVNLTVADVERATAFYESLLGMHVRWEGKLENGRRAVHVGDERCYLALFEAQRPGRPSLDYDVPGINHYGFVVDDLEAARDRLRRLGVNDIMWVDHYEPGRRLYFFDPDGNEVELVEY